MALFCPVTLHLLAPAGEEEVRTVAEQLRSERVAMVYTGPANAALAEVAAAVLDVPVRTDPGLAGLDVPHFGRGAIPAAHCNDALEGIADLHRGEHVLVVGEVPAGPGEPSLRRLQIGDDGWGPLT